MPINVFLYTKNIVVVAIRLVQQKMCLRTHINGFDALPETLKCHRTFQTIRTTSRENVVWRWKQLVRLLESFVGLLTNKAKKAKILVLQNG